MNRQFREWTHENYLTGVFWLSHNDLAQSLLPWATTVPSFFKRASSLLFHAFVTNGEYVRVLDLAPFSSLSVGSYDIESLINSSNDRRSHIWLTTGPRPNFWEHRWRSKNDSLVHFSFQPLLLGYCLRSDPCSIIFSCVASSSRFISSIYLFPAVMLSWTFLWIRMASRSSNCHPFPLFGVQLDGNPVMNRHAAIPLPARCKVEFQKEL